MTDLGLKNMKGCVGESLHSLFHVFFLLSLKIVDAGTAIHLLSRNALSSSNMLRVTSRPA